MSEYEYRDDAGGHPEKDITVITVLNIERINND